MVIKTYKINGWDCYLGSDEYGIGTVHVREDGVVKATFTANCSSDKIVNGTYGEKEHPYQTILIEAIVSETNITSQIKKELDKYKFKKVDDVYQMKREG